MSTAYSARMLGAALEPAVRGDDRDGRGREDDRLAETREQIGGQKPVEDRAGVCRRADQRDRRRDQNRDREPVDHASSRAALRMQRPASGRSRRR